MRGFRPERRSKPLRRACSLSRSERSTLELIALFSRRIERKHPIPTSEVLLMRRMILGLAVAFLGAAAASADEKVDAILKKAIEAHGGMDAMSKYTASRMTMKGELSVMEMDL